MSSEWKVYSLDELCEFINGFAFKSTDYVEPSADTVEVFRMGYISRGGGFKEDSTPVFVPKKYGKNLDKYLLRHGDVTIAMTDMKDKVAILGNTAWISHPDRFVLNQRVGCIRVKRQDLLDPRFFYFYSNSQPHVEHLRTRANSGVQVNLSTSAIKESQIQIPPLSTQLEIAETLAALDDRIALLRDTNATLEAIAQALFKSWFVDFDPVHAKQQGVVAPEGLDEATAALFPDSFEESELGLVPKGWKVELLTEVFDFREGPGIRNWQYTNSDQGTRFINIRCIQDGDLTIKTANRITDEEANGKYAHFHLRAWDVVVSTSGTLGRSAIVRQEHLPLMLNTSVIRFQPIARKMRFCFVYEYLNSIEFLFKLESMASGSVQKNFGPMHLKQMKLVCPPIDLLSHYESVCRPLFEKVVENRARIDTLSTLRDTLLPRLISGQLRLPEDDLNCAS